MATTGPGFAATWAVSMAAMMLPSELPLLRLEHATTRSALRTASVVLGYLSVWTAVALPVWAADRASDGRVLGMHGSSVTALVLGLAAAYQLTPLKSRCLAVCRAPLARILHGWREGLAGAFRMGVVNGISCVGCCLGLTTALLAVGLMNVAWMLVIGVAIVLEKTTRIGVAASRATAGLLALGAITCAA